MKKMLAILLLSMSTSYLVAMEQQPAPMAEQPDLVFQQRVLALHKAIKKTKCADACRTILECPQFQRDALVNARNIEGKTPLMQITSSVLSFILANSKRYDIINATVLLLRHGADPSSTDTNHGATALAYLLISSLLDHSELPDIGFSFLDTYMEILRLLLANPQTTLDNIVASESSSAFHVAAFNSRLPLKVYQLLFACGASTLTADAKGKLPIDLAVQWNNTTAINFLTGISARMLVQRLPAELQAKIYGEVRR